MSVEISESPSAAELELEASLRGLREAISHVPEVERKMLVPVHAALRSLDQSMKAEDDRAFVCALVDLARAVIEVRQGALHGGALAAIPLPPYDLWLPFKAASLRTSDKPSPRDAAWGAVRNSRIGDAVSSSREVLDPFVAESDEQRSDGRRQDETKASV